MSWNEIYKHILKDVLNSHYEFNERTKTGTYRKFNVTFELYNVNYLPALTLRKLYFVSAAAELTWTLQGTHNTRWLKKYTKIWELFEDKPNHIETAYGVRWRTLFKRDQIKELIELLKKDKSSRQGVVLSWNPETDGLLNQGKYKNVPCPYSFVCNIMNNKLNMIVYQRSADLILGLPYDVMMYSLLNMSLAKELNILPGSIAFSIADCHIYENLKEVANNMLKHYKEDFKIPFNSPTTQWITENPDKYIELIRIYEIENYKPNEYNPRLTPVQ